MSATVYKENDYSLAGASTAMAKKNRLENANSYTSQVPKKVMRELLIRRNGPALRDTIIWFSLLTVSGIAGYLLWGSWWAALPFAVYGFIYGGSSDSRWHESLHGTAFKSDWMNNVLYEIASFMCFRESTPWRWSHMRHHSNTLIVGLDPEIASPRPPNIKIILLNLFAFHSSFHQLRKMLKHCVGIIDPQEAAYIPRDSYSSVYFKARIYILIYLSVITASVATGSLLPLMYIGLPSLYGASLLFFFGFTQHAGLAENVLDFRLNSRTIYMNPVFRYLYWNMNYHVEHHMFPMVPYPNLPRLHEAIKHDCPPAYRGMWQTYREIFSAVLKQVKDPSWFVKRKLPKQSRQKLGPQSHVFNNTSKNAEKGWVKVCAEGDLLIEDVVRFNCDDKTYAVYRTGENRFYATDGLCTHGKTHLADGLIQGNQVECPKHNGRFDVSDGSVKRPPVCKALGTYPIEDRDGTLWLEIN